MATIRWTGQAEAVAQVDTFTPGGTIEVGDVFTLTVTGWDGTSDSVSFTATDTTVANVTAGLEAAWNAETGALFTGITAADNTTNLTLTADTAGVPFSVEATTTESGGGDADDQTFSRAATTASAGPSHWDSAGNWSTGAVPNGAHDVYIENSSTEILYGLDQHSITTLTSLNIGKSFTGKIGYNGAAGYNGTYLQIKATTVNIGQHSGSGSPAGSGRIMLDMGATATTINVYDTATTGADTNKPSVRVKGSSITALNVTKGKVGVAYESSETATVTTANVGYTTNKTADSDVYIKSGVTLTTLYKTGGDCELECAATTVTNDAGNLTINTSGAITTLNVNGGNVYVNKSGTITTLNALGGNTDTTRTSIARTITTLKLGDGAIFTYDPSHVTLTNQVAPYDTTGARTVTIN